MGTIYIMTWLVGGLLIYLLPTIVAYRRGVSNRVAIFVCNLVFGWTLLGWGIALIWAVVREKPAPLASITTNTSKEGA